jgi:hypothetical protein
MRRKHGEPNSNDDVGRAVGRVLRHGRVNPPPLDKPEHSGLDPEKTGVDLIFDKLGLITQLMQPSQVTVNDK